LTIHRSSHTLFEVSVRPAQDEYADVAVREYAVRAVELIQKQYTDSVLSVVTVSDSLHVSERHFARLFRAHTGQTFRQYLRDLRMAHAAKLLADPRISVKAIAWTVGYSDASHFSRYFREATGVSPAKYSRHPVPKPAESRAAATSH
jgi:two-component system response regulator YesN